MINDKILYNKFAPIYDYFQGGVRNDIQFYLNYFRGFKGKILEVGAGTGRITIPLLKKGLNVTALDLSPKMLAGLKSKAKDLKVKTVCADMRSFRLKEKFAVIIVTFRAFQHLYTTEDQIKALKSFHKHLKPNGVLIFDVYNPSWKWIAKGDWHWHHADRVKFPGFKKKAQINYRNRYDMATQVMDQHWGFDYPNGKRKIIPLRMRFFFRFELEHLLKMTGFKVIKLYGDFKKHSFKSDSPEMVWVAKKIKS